MLHTKKALPDGSIIAIWKIQESSSELFDKLHNKDVYMLRLAKLSTEKRRQEWLAARILVETFCGKDKIVQYNDNGKPFLADKSFHISISHTKNYIAIIVHSEKKVSIDIEQISEKICRLKERFLHPDELRHIDSAMEMKHLLLHWSAKEVIFKMINEENILFSKQLHILPFIPQDSGIFFGKESKTPQQQHYTFHYEIDTDFVLVWTIENSIT